MPIATDFSCVCSRGVCGPSHAEAGPWQFSQLTPSEMANARPRCSGAVYSAWHARHLGDSSAFAPSFRIRAMRSPTSPVSAWYARLCLSFKIQVLYSVCRMRLSETGFTLPWQLVAAQEPGPMYFCGSAMGLEDWATTEIASTRIAPQAARPARKQKCEKKSIGNRKRIFSLISFGGTVSQRRTLLFRNDGTNARTSIYTPPRRD